MIQVLILFMLIFISIQDFMFRAVYLFCFPVLFILFALNAYQLGELSLKIICGNLIILLIQYMILWIVFRVWKGVSLMKNEIWIGWGDLFFFLALTTAFSSINLLIFQIVSLVLIWIVLQLWRSIGFTVIEIPLAGLQAFILFFVFFYDFLYKPGLFYFSLI